MPSPYMNRLQFETSPYLLQHAHNPVNWFAWKPEAFEKAKREDKPILVSIGYSTCHWCHVMERESFEDESVADFMNKHFINIKVDREERPDVDQIYMEACQIISGSGGWPLNCFLTPDGRPFYAGTYYPPRPMHNRPSWSQLLQNMAGAYQQKREVVEEQANRLMSIIDGSENTFVQKLDEEAPDQPGFTPEQMTAIFENLYQRADKKEGGFGGAPKFPSTMALQYFLDFYALTGNEKALEHLNFSLHKMIRGGIYDQLGGGFARYATDNAWLIPHFEKMLYDNALLVSLMAKTYKVTKDPLLKHTIEETLTFIRREMTSNEGGFYAALDADSEGVEGKFYVWDKSEIEEVLGEEAELFNAFYQVSGEGNWEEKNILWRPETEATFAERQENLSTADFHQQLKQNREQLLKVRSLRVRPGLDDKILLNWNALQCSAYAHAAAALQNEAYKSIAIQNLEFLLNKFQKEDGPGLYHTYKEGTTQYDAFLDDYAFLIAALIDVYELDFDRSRIQTADQLTKYVLDQFLDEQEHLFYFTSKSQKDIVTRRKDLYDSAIPSGNSAMVHNLHRLSIILGKEAYGQLARRMMLSTRNAVAKHTPSFAHWANALLMEAFAVNEVAILGKDAFSLATLLDTYYIPNRILMATDVPFDEYPLFNARYPEKDTLIYVCQNFECRLPVKTVKDALDMMKDIKFVLPSD